jgi:hypothetical protein
MLSAALAEILVRDLLGVNCPARLADSVDKYMRLSTGTPSGADGTWMRIYRHVRAARRTCKR